MLTIHNYKKIERFRTRLIKDRIWFVYSIEETPYYYTIHLFPTDGLQKDAVKISLHRFYTISNTKEYPIVCSTPSYVTPMLLIPNSDIHSSHSFLDWISSNFLERC